MNIFLKIKVVVVNFIEKVEKVINKIRAFFAFIVDYVKECFGR